MALFNAKKNKLTDIDPNHHHQLVHQLYDQGWAVVDNYISDEFRKALLKEQKDFLMHGQFRHAGVGSGNSFTIKPEIRSDKVCWFDPELLTPLQKAYWDTMEELRTCINQRCFLGLRSFEAHFAMYPPGSFYLRHLDQFQAVKYRMVTVILYLNEEWDQEDGGALRIYLIKPDGIESNMEILPLGGRLVAFLSGEMPHEVMPTKKERISITGWFRDIDY